MTTINTLDDANDTPPLQNPWAGQRSNSRNQRSMGHSISGLSAPAPWERELQTMEQGQVHNPNIATIPVQTNMAPRLTDPIWSDNTPQDQPQGFGDYFAIACGCGCCLGPCCSPTRQSDWKRFFTSATVILSLIQIAMFIVSVVLTLVRYGVLSFAIPLDVLLDLGAMNYNKIFSSYQIWRLVTPIFLHSDFVHLLMNTWFAYRVMLPTEYKYNKKKILVVYFVSGVIGCIFSLSFNYSHPVSVGASGALMGILGLSITELYIQWNELPVQMRFAQVANLIVFLFFIFFLGFGSDTVDNYAHLGGLFAGAACSALVITRNATLHAIGAGTLIALVLLPFFVLFMGMA